MLILNKKRKWERIGQGEVAILWSETPPNFFTLYI